MLVILALSGSASKYATYGVGGDLDDSTSKILTMAMVSENYANGSWIHVKTDSSVSDVIKDGGVGNLIQYPNRIY